MGDVARTWRIWPAVITEYSSVVVCVHFSMYYAVLVCCFKWTSIARNSCCCNSNSRSLWCDCQNRFRDCSRYVISFTSVSLHVVSCVQYVDLLFVRSTVFVWIRETLLHTSVQLPFCPGLPGWAGTRKVRPIWILLKQETVSGSGISWAVCKFAPRCRQITTPAPHHSVFYRPDALPATQPTASKHWRQQRNCTNLNK